MGSLAVIKSVKEEDEVSTRVLKVPGLLSASTFMLRCSSSPVQNFAGESPCPYVYQRRKLSIWDLYCQNLQKHETILYKI